MLNTNTLANAHEQLASLGQANVEKAMRLSNIVLSTAERFASLNMELGKKILDQNVETVKALTEAKDPKKLAEISTSLAQPAVDNSLNAARSLYDAAVLTQNEVQSFVEEQQFKPTITIDQGTPMRIYVNKDYKFPKAAVSKTRAAR